METLADDELLSDDVQQQEKSQKKTAKYDSGAADLEKVTDYAEEKEILASNDLAGVSHLFCNHVCGCSLIMNESFHSFQNFADLRPCVFLTPTIITKKFVSGCCMLQAKSPYMHTS